ncbi:hypothetical protein CEXT_352911 [Caerostris extrusa]|uniref:Uncharacterized protein n=1 Tax=Caerostris extrusa TaxID=172846 RepID=A0AAV4WLM4_CAEEX|nr:hypothetical protein CEXT_352911 [Caerostris extrusa]
MNLETVDIDYRPQKARPPFITTPGKVSEYYECSNAGPLLISSKRYIFKKNALSTYAQFILKSLQKPASVIGGKIKAITLSHPVNAINIARRERYLFLPPGVRHPFGIPLHRNLETVDIDYRPQKGNASIYHHAGKVSEYYECSNAGPLQISSKKVMTHRLGNVYWNVCCVGEEAKVRDDEGPFS